MAKMLLQVWEGLARIRAYDNPNLKQDCNICETSSRTSFGAKNISDNFVGCLQMGRVGSIARIQIFPEKIKSSKGRPQGLWADTSKLRSASALLQSA
jgi:hypothetical protein